MERSMTGWLVIPRRLALVVPLALAVSPADAHLMTTGLGPIYDGISHFALSPEDLIPTAALALLAGQCGTAASRRVLFVLPTAWLLGGIAGLAATTSPLPDIAWVSFVILGGLVAANVTLPSAAITALAIVLGLIHGFLNGATMGNPADGMRALVGIAAAIFVVCALVAAAVVAGRWQPLRIGVRVVGSWTAALGMLLLGWSLR
jgi:hydrogenase/urease accessory protein HupE